jgi:hypothetical protein
MSPTSELARVAPSAASLAMVPAANDFLILDTYSENGIARIEDVPRVPYLATISGGFRDNQNRPQRTTAGEMFVHGDAPGLKDALARTEDKALTVMFPSDDPRSFIQQRFTQHSATALLAYGDEKQITIIDKGNRRSVLAGTPEYAARIKECKISCSVYFSLAEWTEDGCDMVFPDGFGLYRLRFTSMNSLRSILSSVQHMAKTTGGRIAGIPFDIFMRQQEHTDPAGMKRRVWIWQCVPRPPHGIRFTPQMFRSIMDSGQEQRKLLQLEGPAPETLELAQTDIVDVELEDALEMAQGGGTCDIEHYRNYWFAAVKDTPLDNDLARADFIFRYSREKTDSLREFLATASVNDAHEMLQVVIAVSHMMKLEKEYEDLLDVGAQYGVKRVELPENATVADVQKYIGALKRLLAKKEEEAAARQAALPTNEEREAAQYREKAAQHRANLAAQPETPTPIAPALLTNGKNAPAPGGDLHQHVAKMRAATTQHSEEEQAEADAVFGAADDVLEGDVSGTPDATQPPAPESHPAPTLPIHIENLIVAARAQNLNVENFLGNGAVLAAVNDALMNTLKLSPVSQVVKLGKEPATLLLPQIANGNLKW